MDNASENLPFIDDNPQSSEYLLGDRSTGQDLNGKGKMSLSYNSLNTPSLNSEPGFSALDVPMETLCGSGSDTVDKPISFNTQTDSILAKDETEGNNSLGLDLRERKNSFKFHLHAAAEKGKVRELQKLLLTKDPLVADFKQRTALHYACGFAYQKKALQMVDAILKSPFAQNTEVDAGRKKRLVDFQDKNGETGLHIAARTGHPEVVEKLLFSAADVNLRDKNNTEPLELIYCHVPTSMKPVYDGAVECKVGDPNDQNLLLKFDFGSIVGYLEADADPSIFQLETKLLSYCLQQSEQKRAAILLHPVVQTFLHFKWKKIRVLLWVSILYHVIWLLLYTLFITDLYMKQCPYKPHLSDEEGEVNATATDLTPGGDNNGSLNMIVIESDELNNLNKTSSECNIGSKWSSLCTELTFLYFVTISVVLKEMYEIYSTSQLKYYFMQLENLGQWVLIGVVSLTSIPMFTKDAHGTITIYSWQYQASAFGIFLAWSLILSQIGKVPRFGVYIEILAKVLKSFVMFMITFASLLVAFMISFQILMPEKSEFWNPWGFIKVMMMMVGELNYDDVFYSDQTNEYIPFPTSTKLLYGLFVAIVTIILFNLLIGLTVSDIQGLQSVAQLSSISSQLEQIYLMERFVISKKLQHWLKRFDKNHWLRYFLVTQQTLDTETNLGVDIHITKIPRELQYSIREIAIPTAVQQSEEDEDNETRLG